MAIGKLARIDWQMGQTLLPEHFSFQEESLLTDISLRFSLLGMPFYGIGRLKWNDSLLADGILSLLSMTVVLPSGLLIEVPKNAKIRALNMNITGLTKVPVYFHLLSEKTESSSDEESSDEDSISRKYHYLELSPDQSHSDSLQTMKLAEFEKNPEGLWELSPDYVPPLLQVGTSPFLQDELNSLAQTIEVFHYKLIQEIATSYLSGEALFNAKQCLKGVYNIQRFLANLRNQIHFHPYFIYEALKSFYVDFCLYHDTTPEKVASPYLHDQLGPCLKEITRPLLEQMQLTKSKSPYKAFTQQGGLFVIPELPKEVSRAREVYFLIQKNSVSEELSLEGLKLANISRLPVVHQLALMGVPLQKIDSPPFQHPFGAEVDFFLIVEGEEWDHVLHESTLAFYSQPTFQNMNAYLYWRRR